MKRHLSLACLVLISMSIGWTLAETRHSDLAQIKELEHQVWEAWKHQDVETVRRLSAPDYVSSNGETVTHFAEELRYVPLTVLKSYQVLGEIHTLQVSPDVVILFYPLKMEGTEDGKDISGRIAVASAWARRDGKWLNVFVYEVPTKE
jgi:uncharacterized protein DUF4440